MEQVRSAATLASLCLGLALPAVSLGAAFAPYQSIATGSSPEAVAIGDVNGDGRNDVVMTTSYNFDAVNDYKVMVFLQTTDGQLAPPVRYGTAGTYTAAPKSVAIADMDNDGRNDVVIGNSGASIQVFLQQSDGTLGAPSTLPTPYSDKIRVGDLNNDGLPEVAGIDWGSAEVAIFLQGPGGTLLPGGTWYAPNDGYEDLELGDVNNDGLTDIVITSGQGAPARAIAVLRQLAGGGFAPVSLHDVGDYVPWGVGIGDFTGDGRNDVVVGYGGNQPASRIGIFPQETDGTLGLPFSLPSYDIPGTLEVADVTGDGRDDVIVLHGGWYAMGVYTQPLPGAAPAAEELFPLPYASDYNPHGLAVGDINGDRKPDVVIADYNNGLVVLHNAAPNQPPVAEAGANRAAISGTRVRLDGTASTDTDGTIVRYKWRQISGPTVTLVKVSPGVVRFVAPPVTEPTRMVFQLRVTDDQGAADTDRVVIRVKPGV